MLERGGIELARLAAVRLVDPRQQVVEVLNAFAGTEVDAEAIAIHAVLVEQTRMLQRLLRGDGGELAVDARNAPSDRSRE